MQTEVLSLKFHSCLGKSLGRKRAGLTPGPELTTGGLPSPPLHSLLGGLPSSLEPLVLSAAPNIM
jgi:hypothetical protein